MFDTEHVEEQCRSGLLNPNLDLQMIDEVHTLIGAGAAEGAIDAANILKPALARGELQCIGATTLDEYRKHIEKDPALERYLSPLDYQNFFIFHVGLSSC